MLMDHVNTHIANTHGIEPQGPEVSALIIIFANDTNGSC